MQGIILPMSDETRGLQHELKQSIPFSPAQEATLSILRTADRVRRRLSTQLDPHGVTLQQYNVLRILRGARGEPLPTLEIGERMIEEAPGVTRLLDRLEAKGLVRRSRCTQDRRLVHCWITDQGLELLGRIDPEVTREDEAPVSVLSTDEQRTLIRLLERIREVTG
jgi:MarR family transcriptional regulator, organic hydroperoxide resistance regulator